MSRVIVLILCFYAATASEALVFTKEGRVSSSDYSDSTKACSINVVRFVYSGGRLAFIQTKAKQDEKSNIAESFYFCGTDAGSAVIHYVLRVDGVKELEYDFRCVIDRGTFILCPPFVRQVRLLFEINGDMADLMSGIRD